MTDEAPEWGPAMSKLDERERLFVVNRVYYDMNPTQAAKAAGYSDKTDGYLRVQGHRMNTRKSIIAALREEAEKKFGADAAIALARLGDRGQGKKATIQDLVAVTDRAGYGPRVQQDIRVEHVDNRSTAELMAELHRLLPSHSLPVIEGEVVDVKED